ncbi:hypothetical protein [Bosea sp. PAMC 26642]|uniref:hypothetical protein n=1 Tax=Bosea sp. (strain PAMC 26642) TaxID=1792307 RepID=UPI000A852AA6|nr:hypothetical protein [Bosea sp. PAMC 26642]
MLATAATCLCASLALAFLLDPYDTGRTPLRFANEGVRPQGPRTAAASRGRDPAFRGAIFGNSHIQLISPERLKDATTIPFVSLIAPGSRPREAFVLLNWFLRHHPKTAEALVIGIDDFWCDADPALPAALPFPYWLYAEGTLEYLGRLMRFDVIEEFLRRFTFITGKRPVRARPDGYWDYEDNYLANGNIADPGRRADLGIPRALDMTNATGRFPAAERLEALLAKAPPEAALILVRPPVYVTALPIPGSDASRADAACRDAYAALAARRSRSVLLDWRIDRPEMRDPDNFFDHSHYRQAIARLVEADIAAALARIR